MCSYPGCRRLATITIQFHGFRRENHYTAERDYCEDHWLLVWQWKGSGDTSPDKIRPHSWARL